MTWYNRIPTVVSYLNCSIVHGTLSTIKATHPANNLVEFTVDVTGSIIDSLYEYELADVHHIKYKTNLNLNICGMVDCSNNTIINTVSSTNDPDYIWVYDTTTNSVVCEFEVTPDNHVPCWLTPNIDRTKIVVSRNNKCYLVKE